MACYYIHSRIWSNVKPVSRTAVNAPSANTWRIRKTTGIVPSGRICLLSEMSDTGKRIGRENFVVASEEITTAGGMTRAGRLREGSQAGHEIVPCGG